MNKSDLQFGFSEQHKDVVFAEEGRAQKASKVLAILQHYCNDLKNLSALDIGCSAGNTTKIYAKCFKSVTGIDIDAPAIEYAVKHNSTSNLSYHVMSSQEISFPSGSFDMIICNHIYEHVPDAAKLLDEIHRLLKFNGVCYFAAGNRLRFMEPHYRLPLLSVVPKSIAHLYIRVLGRGKFYYEKHLTYWSLRKLVSKFELIDYTVEVIRSPDRFAATDMLQPGSAKQNLALGMLSVAYWLCPTYLWLLKKT